MLHYILVLHLVIFSNECLDISLKHYIFYSHERICWICKRGHLLSLASSLIKELVFLFVVKHVNMWRYVCLQGYRFDTHSAVYTVCLFLKWCFSGGCNQPPTCCLSGGPEVWASAAAAAAPAFLTVSSGHIFTFEKAKITYQKAQTTNVEKNNLEHNIAPVKFAAGRGGRRRHHYTDTWNVPILGQNTWE